MKCRKCGKEITEDDEWNNICIGSGLNLKKPKKVTRKQQLEQLHKNKNMMIGVMLAIGIIIAIIIIMGVFISVFIMFLIGIPCMALLIVSFIAEGEMCICGNCKKIVIFTAYDSTADDVIHGCRHCGYKWSSPKLSPRSYDYAN